MNKDLKAIGLPNGGPSITAPALWTSVGGAGFPLTAEDRAMLASVATVTRFRKGDRIYEEGIAASSVFNIISGIMKCYRSQDHKRQYVVGFLLPQDILGLAENGRYVNSAEAVTAVTAYRIPASVFEARLRTSVTLDFRVIGKLCRELRNAQDHALLLSRSRAVVKLALFIKMFGARQAEAGLPAGEVYLPMTQADIGGYINVAPEVVSRSLRELARCGAVAVRDRRHVAITDPAKLEAICTEADACHQVRRAECPVPGSRSEHNGRMLAAD